MLTGQADLLWPFTIPCMHLKGVLLTCRIAQLLDVPGLRREASNLAPKLIAVLQPVFAAGKFVRTILKHVCARYGICMHFEWPCSHTVGIPVLTLSLCQLHCHAVAWYMEQHKKGTRGLFHPRYCMRFPFDNRQLHIQEQITAYELLQHCIHTF